MIPALAAGGIAARSLLGAERTPLALPKAETERSFSLEKAKATGKAGESEASESAKKSRDVALQFEEVLVRQMLQPLEESMGRAMGTENASPMVGSLVLDSLSQSIRDSGGLGFADVIEEALRRAEGGSSEK